MLIFQGVPWFLLKGEPKNQTETGKDAPPQYIRHPSLETKTALRHHLRPSKMWCLLLGRCHENPFWRKMAYFQRCNMLVLGQGRVFVLKFMGDLGGPSLVKNNEVQWHFTMWTIDTCASQRWMMCRGQDFNELWEFVSWLLWLAYLTSQKTNKSPENQWLEDVFLIKKNSPILVDMLVFRGVGTQYNIPHMLHVRNIYVHLD